MNTAIVRIAAVLGVLLSGSLCPAAGTPWLDAVAFSSHPAGLSDAWGVAADALGPITGVSVSIITPEVPVLDFTGNALDHDPGGDPWVHEAFLCAAVLDVHAGKDNVAYTYVGRAVGGAGPDLTDHPGLLHVNCFRIVGMSGDKENYDLDATEAIHLLDTASPDPDLPTPGAIFLIAIGASFVSCLRWRRTF